MTSRSNAFFHPCSHRMHLVLLLMLGWAITSYQRTNLGMTMTCMVNSTAVTMIQHQNVDYKKHNHVNRCFVNQTTSDGIPANNYGGELLWSPRMQNLLFSSSFWGCMLSNIPAGYISDRFSPRNALFLAVLIMSISTFSIPFITEFFGFIGVFIARFIYGIGDGFVLPTANWIISRWVPRNELSQAGSLFTSGFQIAGIVGVPISAAFCDSSVKWPGVFYLCGLMGILWCVIFLLTGKDSPQKSKVISRTEKAYLVENIADHRQVKGHAKIKQPWREMFTSVPLLACLYSSFCFHVFLMFIASYTPSFFKEVYYLKTMDNGIYSALPHLGQMLTKILWGVFIDHLKIRGKISQTTSVRVSQSFSCILVGIVMLIVRYNMDCEKVKLVGALYIMMGLALGPATSGFFTSLLSLAPLHTGTLTSMSMLVGSFGMIACPWIVDMFRVDGTPEEWQTIMLIISLLIISSGFIFGTMASGEAQNWAVPKASEMDVIEAKQPLNELQESII
ncbi:unnamed protein product [Bursaphelenchus xylophilus]|uniref:(pine wood nematode) hypothetical protein n=1 Tax=Bursaphelenchus xylophilus TaxID=6326 RepID=A0A1I7S3W8_BURXY|nr:unnamed protein product [Bursaphelenchus xylophilus]CAG9116540.1 unnamed protein product [Bursaphelenchus xylophilus]